jgi:integration host factor subunit beta
MIKSELTQRVLAQNPHLFFATLKRSSTLSSKKSLRRWRAATAWNCVGLVRSAWDTARRRNGRNPQNGAFIAVNQKNMPHFKPGKEMHERLNKAQG